MIYDLIRESTSTGDLQQGRPSLLALTRAVNALVYKDLVAIQETTQPKATIFGIRYLDGEGNLPFVTPATYSGRYSKRDGLDELSSAKKNFAKGDIFKYQQVVYQAIEAVDIDKEDGVDLGDKLFTALMVNKVRMVSDAAEVDYYETNDVQEINFKLDRWAIDTKTRKLKSLVTQELLQDLNANGLKGDDVVKDLLATMISGEVNKDVMQKLQTVSKRHISEISPNGIVHLAGVSDDPAQARAMYRMVSEMAYSIVGETTFEATYVLCSPKIAGLLSASGWMKGESVSLFI